MIANNDAQLRRREQPLFAAYLNLSLSKTGNYSLIKLLNFSERLEVFVVNSNHVARLWNFVSISPSLRNGWRVALCLAAVLATSLSGAGVFAQTPARAGKLPSPEKIVGEYLKAVGGKKRVAGVRDAVYEWSVEGQQQGTTALRIQRRSPDAERRDV
ncbi:MAG: hypothetical protein H0W34_10075, partial [Pyrinomonadaceae bacterium]|nr:hypothetical protein [Pyrinomonadaceae bacterium]